MGSKGINALAQVLRDPSAKPGEKAAAGRTLAELALKISSRTTEVEADREAAEEEKASEVKAPRNLTFTLMKPVLPDPPE